jgi:hypothetical protein
MFLSFSQISKSKKKKSACGGCGSMGVAELRTSAAEFRSCGDATTV